MIHIPIDHTIAGETVVIQRSLRMGDEEVIESTLEQTGNHPSSHFLPFSPTSLLITIL